MATDFSRTLSLLRQEKGISQRKAAAALGISQALLSHYENGIREPGLAFVCKVCDFYRVSADFLLGRTSSRDGSIIEAAELYDASDEKGTLKGSILATLQKKLVVNTTGVLFDLLGKCGDRTAITAAGVVAPMVTQFGINPVLAVLVCACASNTITPMYDGGYLLFQQSFGLSMKDTYKTWGLLELVNSVVGLIMVLILSLFI